MGLLLFVFLLSGTDVHNHFIYFSIALFRNRGLVQTSDSIMLEAELKLMHSCTNNLIPQDSLIPRHKMRDLASK